MPSDFSFPITHYAASILAQRAALFLFESTIVLLVTFSLVRLFRTFGAATTVMIFRTGVISTVAVTVVTFGFGGSRSGLVHIPTPKIIEASSNQIHYLKDPTMTMMGTPALSVLNSASTYTSSPSTPKLALQNVVHWIVYVWISGTLFGLFRICRALGLLRQFRKGCKDLTADAAEELKTVATALGVKTPRLLSSRDITSPMLIGIFQPAIVLPSDYQSEFNSPEFKSILVHELTHIVWKDNAWKLFTSMIYAICWPQVLLAFAHSCMSEAAEIVCDEAVLKNNVPTNVYAGCLVKISERLSFKKFVSVSQRVIGFKSSLGRRVSQIMNSNKHGLNATSHKTKYLVSALTIVLSGITVLTFDIGASARSAGSKSQDSKTPRESIEGFLEALSSGDLVKSARFVKNSDIVNLPKYFIDEAKAQPLKSKVKSYTETITGNSASVNLTITLLSDAKPIDFTETVSLLKSDNSWLISSDTMPENKAQSDTKLVGTIAYVLSHTGVVQSTRKQALATSCVTNIKQVGIGALMLVSDYNNVFKIKASNYKASLMPYIKNDKIFYCSDGGAKAPQYTFNKNMEMVNMTKVHSPSEVVLIYEGSNGVLDFRHDGFAAVCFVDGHAKLINKDAAAKLKWKP